MTSLDVFRQEFSGLMLRCARDRKRVAGSAPTGEDLKVIALFERFAREAETFDQDLETACRARLAPEPPMRCFIRHRGDLLAQVGVIVWPAHADDLAAWMTRQIGGAMAMSGAVSSDAAWETVRASAADARDARTRRSWRWANLPSEFTVGLSLLGPFLGLWQVQRAVGQMHERAFAGSHAAVPATILSAQTAGWGKSASPPTTVVLQFRPTPAGPACRVTVLADFPPIDARAGQSLMVVPRSPDCGVPMIPSRIGDPAVSLAVAVALIAGGIGALVAWTRSGLRRRLPHHHHPAWS